MCFTTVIALARFHLCLVAFPGWADFAVALAVVQTRALKVILRFLIAFCSAWLHPGCIVTDGTRPRCKCVGTRTASTFLPTLLVGPVFRLPKSVVPRPSPYGAATSLPWSRRFTLVPAHCCFPLTDSLDLQPFDVLV